MRFVIAIVALPFLFMLPTASASYANASGSSDGVYYADLGITIVGPQNMRELVLDTLETMPYPWREYVLEHIRVYRQVQGVDWTLGTWQDEVRMNWEPRYVYTRGEVVWMFQASLVHEAKHVDDWKRCIVLGGPASEARSLYLQAEFYFNIAWRYYPEWRDYFYGQGEYYAALAGKHGQDQPWRILKRECTIAYDPVSGRSVTISPDWVRN